MKYSVYRKEVRVRHLAAVCATVENSHQSSHCDTATLHTPCRTSKCPCECGLFPYNMHTAPSCVSPPQNRWGFSLESDGRVVAEWQLAYGQLADDCSTAQSGALPTWAGSPWRSWWYCLGRNSFAECKSLWLLHRTGSERYIYKTFCFLSCSCSTHIADRLDLHHPCTYCTEWWIQGRG